jgi:hypothetical protein
LSKSQRISGAVLAKRANEKPGLAVISPNEVVQNVPCHFLHA